jgi:hypothetical protein
MLDKTADGVIHLCFDPSLPKEKRRHRNSNFKALIV